LDDLTFGGTAGFSSDTGNRLDSHMGIQQKKTANMTSWLQSDYSIFDSQPQTTKVKKGSIEDRDSSKERIIEQFKMKRCSVSEKNILAALKSPIVQDTKKSTANMQAESGQLMATCTKLQISPQLACQIPVTAVKKKDRKKDKQKKSSTNVFGTGTGTFDDRGKKSMQGNFPGISKEAEKEIPKQKPRPKSREGSLKFLTENVKNVFGEKFSLITSSALGQALYSHRRPINQGGVSKRERSISKEKRKAA
jgi:hypothetical protein